MSEENELPEGWVWTTLDSIAEVNPGVDTSSLPNSTYVSFIPMASVEAETGYVDTSSHRLLSEVRRGYTVFQENDIIFAKITPCMENGKVAIARPLSSGVGFGSTEFHVLRSEKGIEPEFLYYYVSRSLFRQVARKAMTGSAGQLRVPASFLSDTSFLLPPTNEQQRIVESIEEQFSLLDDSTTTLQKDLIRLKRAREAVLKFAVEGKITDEWREENPVAETGSELLARVLTERRARWEAAELEKMRAKGIVPKDEKWKEKYKEPIAPDTKKLPELPDGWCWATVDQISQIQGGIQKQPSRAPRRNAFPYLRVANVLRNRLDLSVIEKMELFGNELNILRLKVGDLLIVEGNGSRTEIGRSTLWHGEIENCVHQNHIIRVRLSDVLPEYLNHYWNSPDGNQRVMDVAASTTGLYTLSVSKIASLPVPLPPLEEQEQIVNEVEMQLSIIAHTEASIEANIKRIENTRQLILAQAFAGELVEQDPDDEPASILLERICEERKQREQEEQQRRKEERMNGANNGRAKRTPKKGRQPLQQVLIEAEQPLTPDELFHQARLKADVAEDVDDFFEELRDEVVVKKRINVERPDNTKVLLSASEVIKYEF